MLFLVIFLSSKECCLIDYWKQVNLYLKEIKEVKLFAFENLFAKGNVKEKRNIFNKVKIIETVNIGNKTYCIYILILK